MRSRTMPTALLALVTLAMIAAPLALGQGDVAAPPAGATTTQPVGPLDVTVWVETPTTASVQNVSAGSGATLWVYFAATENGTYNATATVAAGTGATLQENATFETGNVTADAPAAHPVPFQADDDAKGASTFTVDVTVYRHVPGAPATNETNATADRWERAAAGAVAHTVTITAPAPAPPEDGLPWPVIGAAGAVLVVGGGAAYAVYKRRQVPQTAPRSQALRETRMERKKPAVREEVRQQAEQQAAERQKSRELQILEAKRDDLRRSIELARRRVDNGELTEHQFQRIKEKKEDALEDVLREIEDTTNEGGGS